MKFYYLVSVTLFSVFLLSCGSSKLPISNFSELSDITCLDGTYQNESNKELPERYNGYNYKLSRMFSLPFDTIDSVNLRFSKKNVTLTFKADSVQQEKKYKGKLKKNYFEVYLQKKIGPIPFIYFGWNIEKVRIGQNKLRYDQGWL